MDQGDHPLAQRHHNKAQVFIDIILNQIYELAMIEKSKFKKNFALLCLLIWGVFFAPTQANAQTVDVGGHIGALGAASTSDIAYGAHFVANPFGFAGFKVDVTFTPMEGGTFFSSSPAIIFYPIDFAEMQLGVLGGAGFYRAPGDRMRFGMNFGALGNFALTESFSVGMETRYHSIFSTADAWTVLLTAAFKFELGGAW